MIFVDNIRYLWEQLIIHFNLFYPPDAIKLILKSNIYFLPFEKAIRKRGKAIVIPIDISGDRKSIKTTSVNFNHTTLTFWNLFESVGYSGWNKFIQNDDFLFYIHETGTIMLPYNAFFVINEVLNVNAERINTHRDEHGRCLAKHNYIYKSGLLEVPFFNEFAALLLLLCLILDGNKTRMPVFPKELHPKSYVVLSHDCDILFGNDIFTQIARLYKIFSPIANHKLPKLSNIYWYIYNYICPESFYLNNLLGMIETEKMLGYSSSIYFLNGKGGRFGARNGNKGLANLASCVRLPWRIGMHYNYNTFNNSHNFIEQKNELENITGTEMVAGRAHYLRINIDTSFDFLHRHGIIVDESFGYSDAIGYRCGIGGIFIPHDIWKKRKVFWELPLNIMLQTLFEQYPASPHKKLIEMIHHTNSIGGSLSLLCHPGEFYNPEIPQTKGIYRMFIGKAKAYGFESITAIDIAKKATEILYNYSKHNMMSSLIS